MKKVELKAERRQLIGRKVKNLRLKHQVPAVLYGKGIKNEAIVVNENDLISLFKESHSNLLINLQIDDQPAQLVFLKDIQRHPITEAILHCDFWKINPRQLIKTEVNILPVGEAPAVKELGGILLQNKSQLQIQARPDDLISEIKVDISGLKTFDDKIQVKDIQPGGQIEILDQPDEAVFVIQEPRSEEELEELEEKPEENVDEVAVEKEKAVGEKGEEEAKEENKHEEKIDEAGSQGKTEGRSS